MNFNIRKVKIEDIKQVQFVAKTSWHDTYEGIIPRNIQDNFLKQAYNEEMMKHRMEESLFLVAEVKDDIVGFANFFIDGKAAELAAIYVLPNYQGDGIGTALLERGLSENESVTFVYLNVEKDNQLGISFYKAKGFQVVSEFDDNFDGHILKTIRMVVER